MFHVEHMVSRSKTMFHVKHQTLFDNESFAPYVRAIIIRMVIAVKSICNDDGL